MLRRFLGLASALLALAPARGLLAAPPADGARLAYDVPEGCPSAAEFVASVGRRGRRVVASHEGASLHVAIEGPRDGSYRGTLRVSEPGAESLREVRAGSCVEVAEALSLVVSGALAPAAPTAEGAAPAGQEAEPDTVVRQPPRSVAVREGELTFERDVSASLYAGRSTGFLPVPVPRYELTLDMSTLLSTPDRRTFAAGPIVRVKGTLLGRASYRASGSKTDFDGFAVGVEVCGPFYRDTKGFSALLCSGFAGGGLSLKTTEAGTGAVLTKTPGIGTAGMMLDLSYRPTSHFHLGALLGAEYVMGDRSVQGADGRTLFEASPWALSAQLGAGVHF